MRTLLLWIVWSLVGVASERIITLSPALNEIIFALGEGERIVANTTHSTFPNASKHLPKVGGFFSPSLERILSLNPTLVVMQPNNHKLAQKLTKLRIPTQILPIHRLNDIRHAITTLGVLLNQETKAKSIVEAINDALLATQGITQDKKILLVIGHNTALVKNIFVVGSDLYLHDILTASGNHNALRSSRKGQPILNQESLIATNPDIVILLAHAMQHKGLTKEDLITPWLSLPINASRRGDIYIIDKQYAGIPSDRLIYFLRDFKAILEQTAHP
jgi:iron complex transport system substrate-binding protein